jgi:hypothetical protein
MVHPIWFTVCVQPLDKSIIRPAPPCFKRDSSIPPFSLSASVKEKTRSSSLIYAACSIDRKSSTSASSIWARQVRPPPPWSGRKIIHLIWLSTTALDIALEVVSQSQVKNWFFTTNLFREQLHHHCIIASPAVPPHRDKSGMIIWFGWWEQSAATDFSHDHSPGWSSLIMLSYNYILSHYVYSGLRMTR